MVKKATSISNSTPRNYPDVVDTETDKKDIEFPGEHGDSCTPQNSANMEACIPEKCRIKKQLEAERRDAAFKRITVRAKTNIWENACNEVKEELNELNAILMFVGLPPSNYSSLKTFPIPIVNDETMPHFLTCTAKDYMDYYVFPNLMPAIEALIKFVIKNRILQCRRSTFNPLDFLSEYLYNHNPLFYDRQHQPTPLFEINFVLRWLAKYPTKPLPKWMQTTKDEAARIIQRSFRGYLVRKRDDVQEMRIFWRNYKQDLIDEANQRAAEPVMTEDEASRVIQNAFRGYMAKKRHADTEQKHNLEENLDDQEEPAEQSDFDSDGDPKLNPHLHRTHSQDCEICARFREFISKTINIHPEHSVSFKNPENVKEKSPPKSPPPFVSRYDHCCFHPEGHLAFTTHTSSHDLSRPPLRPAYICMSDRKANISILQPLDNKQSSDNQLVLQSTSSNKNQKTCEASCQKRTSLPQVNSKGVFPILDPFLSCKGVDPPYEVQVTPMET